ncbi:MAG: bifunctional diaminohydroxyphosphoribosylaminopyrimidine deaminase/5-amino-6-(5-phosphoribosylamino)uracil reductase RibD [Planctomycetes bacterium]|nr:bifunctional diaminohydroxyphosphoribosylaminopyrimidine deaminase/5-amino-6-(5-phosphoribosylamino)uracil reductase RibD [Planctomycetota bacterium]
MTAYSKEEFMREALELARRGRGRVEPNPMVGCVIAKNGAVVGRGRHRSFGGDHAEVEALRDAGADAAGADVYVTLEPCAHHGKTPPCTDALIRADVKRVIMAMSDPFPQTGGIGPKKLADAGIEVETGLLEHDARELNASYLKLVTCGRSYVIAKWAMSLDGKIATRTGDSRWISGEESRKLVHEIRNEVDAIMVGVGTVLHDDPQLTCRIPGGRNPRRIIVDGPAETPPASQLVRTAREVETIIATTEAAPAERTDPLAEAGCEIIRLPAKDGLISVADLLAETARRRFTNILVEGGGGLLASMFEEDVVDEVRVFVAPVIIGGAGARAPVAGCGVEKLCNALRLRTVTTRRVGDDTLIVGRK